MLNLVNQWTTVNLFQIIMLYNIQNNLVVFNIIWNVYNHESLIYYDVIIDYQQYCFYRSLVAKEQL